MGLKYKKFVLVWIQACSLFLSLNIKGLDRLAMFRLLGVYLTAPYAPLEHVHK